jgi:hypothetical protein
VVGESQESFLGNRVGRVWRSKRSDIKNVRRPWVLGGASQVLRGQLKEKLLA